MTIPLSEPELDLRRALVGACAKLAAQNGGAAELDLRTPITTGPGLSHDEVRRAVVDVWEVLCRDDRRWSFPERLALRCADGEVLTFTAADLPEFPTETADVAGRDVGYSLAAHRMGVSIVPVPADAFPGRRTPSALLRRGPDDIGTYAVFSTLAAGSLDQRVAALTGQILDGALRLRDVGGGEVVVDGRRTGDGEALTSADAYRGYRDAVAAATSGTHRLPSAVTVVLDRTSIRLDTPEPLRGNPPVRLLVAPPRFDVGPGEIVEKLAATLRGQLTEHRGEGGLTLTVHGGGGRDYPTRLVWTAEQELPGFSSPVVLRVRSGDERFSARDAVAMAALIHDRRGWRVGVLIGTETVVDHPRKELRG